MEKKAENKSRGGGQTKARKTVIDRGRERVTVI